MSFLAIFQRSTLSFWTDIILWSLPLTEWPRKKSKDSFILIAAWDKGALWATQKHRTKKRPDWVFFFLRPDFSEAGTTEISIYYCCSLPDWFFRSGRDSPGSAIWTPWVPSTSTCTSEGWCLRSPNCCCSLISHKAKDRLCYFKISVHISRVRPKSMLTIKLQMKLEEMFPWRTVSFF